MTTIPFNPRSPASVLPVPWLRMNPRWKFLLHFHGYWESIKSRLHTRGIRLFIYLLIYRKKMEDVLTCHRFRSNTSFTSTCIASTSSKANNKQCKQSKVCNNRYGEFFCKESIFCIFFFLSYWLWDFEREREREKSKRSTVYSWCIISDDRN